MPSTPPSLVKSASRAASDEHRLLQLDADQRPGARGDVGEVVLDAPAPPTTAEAVSWEPDRDDRDAGDRRRPARPPRPGRARARRRARAAGTGSPRAGRAAWRGRRPTRGSARRTGPWSRRWCARRRSARSASSRPGRGRSSSCSADSRAAVPWAAASWYRVLNGRNCRPLRGVQLGRPDRSSTRAATPLGAVVAVAVAGCRAASPLPVEQPVVDRPRVDADAVQRPGARPPRAGRSSTARWRPRTSQCSAPSARTPAVGEAVHLAPGAASAGRPGRRIDAAAGRAEVDGRDRTGRAARAHRRKAAATPESTGMCRPVVWVRSGPLSTKTASATFSGSDLALEDRALRVELAEVLLLHAVGRGAVGAPAAGEDARAAHDAVGVDAVDPDAVLAELDREQPHLVGLVGLRRASRRCCSGPAKTEFFDEM